MPAPKDRSELAQQATDYLAAEKRCLQLGGRLMMFEVDNSAIAESLGVQAGSLSSLARQWGMFNPEIGPGASIITGALGYDPLKKGVLVDIGPAETSPSTIEQMPRALDRGDAIIQQLANLPPDQIAKIYAASAVALRDYMTA